MNAGSVLAQFTVKLTKPATEPVAVLWRTVDGTAKAGVDYAAAAGTVNFAVGEDTKTLEVLVYGRAVGSENRTFSVLMLPPGNAILGQSVAECIITVDTTGSTPVVDIILPDGPRGLQGKSSYQSWLDAGHTGTEADFVNWLRPTPEEIANEIAPNVNVGDSSLTVKDTATLGYPDTTDVKTLAKRIAYADVALIATVALGDGDNTIEQADFAGDAIDLRSPFISFRISHNGAMVDADWSVGTDGKLTIKGATAGDVLYGVEYRLLSKKNCTLTANNNNLSAAIRAALRANISAAMSGVNSDITGLKGIQEPIASPNATQPGHLTPLSQVNSLISELATQMGAVNTDSINRDNALGGRIDDAGNRINGLDWHKRNCTAWVFFNGTNGQIWDSFNVASITKIATGKYVINFSTAMANSSYTYTFGTGDSSASGTLAMILALNGSPSGAPFRKDIYGIEVWNRASGGLYDGANLSVVFHGGK